jgi:hypothetical protein
MREFQAATRLTSQIRHGLGICRDLVPQKLDRYFTAERHVAGFPDDAHAAAPDQPGESETTRNARAGLEDFSRARATMAGRGKG